MTDKNLSPKTTHPPSPLITATMGISAAACEQRSEIGRMRVPTRDGMRVAEIYLYPMDMRTVARAKAAGYEQHLATSASVEKRRKSNLALLRTIIDAERGGWKTMPAFEGGDIPYSEAAVEAIAASGLADWLGVLAMSLAGLRVEAESKNSGSGSVDNTDPQQEQQLDASDP